MSYENLLDETKAVISDCGYSIDDVRFVGSRDGELGIPWSQAEKVLDIDYDNGYGSREIAADLVVVFTDGGFLRREEYDGSEWWEYEPPFRVPETQKPFKLVKTLSYRTQVLVDINYPMEATEMNNLIHCGICGYLMPKRWVETIDGKTYCRDCVLKNASHRFW